MKPGDFVYKSVRDEAVKKGADLRIAENEARECFDIYRKNRFNGTVAQLLQRHIAAAVKKSKDREKSTL